MELEGDFIRFSRPVSSDRVCSRLFHPARALDVCFISARSGFQAPLSTAVVETVTKNLASPQKANVGEKDF